MSDLIMAITGVAIVTTLCTSLAALIIVYIIELIRMRPRTKGRPQKELKRYE